MSTSQEEKENIVIIGGGIIGCTIAYYLTRHPRFDPSLQSITVIEAARIANGASGKAGGLLASWAYPNDLAALSFDLHNQLAEEHNGVELWGYRRVHCGQLAAAGRKLPGSGKLEGSHSTISLGKWWSRDGKTASVLPDDLDWLNTETAQAYEALAGPKSTAQIHPLQFTTSIFRLAEARGAAIIMGQVEHINCHDVQSASGVPTPLTSFQDLTQKKVVSVTYTDKATSEMRTILTSTVVLAAGPWTPTLFPKVHMSPLRAHSVTIKVKKPVSAYCLFTNITISETTQSSTLSPAASSAILSAEIYGRPNNEVYICSQGDTNSPLPPPTQPVEVSAQASQEIIDAAACVSDILRQGQVTSRRACYLPTATTGTNSEPLVGHTIVDGLLLATRHSCWGILNAPATGKIISELIFDGSVSCVEAGNLDPRKIL